jgi:quercetin dioxygenase-like cupin family protein
MKIRVALVAAALVLLSLGKASTAQSTSQRLSDAVTADPKHYTLEFENDIVRVLRVRLGAGESTPRHSHSAYCAIEITDSSLKEGDGPTSESKAGQVFCGDSTSHGPRNVGKAIAESIVVEFKNRQKAR